MYDPVNSSSLFFTTTSFTPPFPILSFLFHPLAFMSYPSFPLLTFSLPLLSFPFSFICSLFYYPSLSLPSFSLPLLSFPFSPIAFRSYPSLSLPSFSLPLFSFLFSNNLPSVSYISFLHFLSYSSHPLLHSCYLSPLFLPLQSFRAFFLIFHFLF